jgi:vacuolar-type H+-ATPase subunit I/STV1
VATVEKKAETLGGKVAGTYVGGVKLSREVTASLNDQKKLAADLAKMKLDGAKEKAKKKAEDKIGELEKKFSKLFEKAADMNAKAERAETQLKAVKKALEELGDKTKPLAYFEKALNALVAVGLGAAAAGVGIVHAAGEVLEIAKEGVSLTAELAVQVKEALD